MKIAFYGKGGIGKSTIAANISAMYASKGKKVLHIGCDPKSDSTRLLLSEPIPAVLQMIEEKGNTLKREDIIFQGKNGVFCVEAGGPHAGMGCAGLGINAAMQELERLQVLSEEWDLIVYDVLGDVVCGGFSVPMRKHYVDKVFIVTSTDYMSLYAANNILKGALRYSDDKECLVAGYIVNHIKEKTDFEIVKRFSDYTGINSAALIQESAQMKRADYKNELFTELFPESDNTLEIMNLLTNMFCSPTSDKEWKNTVHCMSKEELELFREEIFDKGWIL